jgi:hypothetical protein
MYWPCGQDPGRKPEGHQRALAREAMSLGEQSSDLQGQHLWVVRRGAGRRAECLLQRDPARAQARPRSRRRLVALSAMARSVCTASW